MELEKAKGTVNIQKVYLKDRRKKMKNLNIQQFDAIEKINQKQGQRRKSPSNKRQGVFKKDRESSDQKVKVKVRIHSKSPLRK